MCNLHFPVEMFPFLLDFHFWGMIKDKIFQAVGFKANLIFLNTNYENPISHRKEMQTIKLSAHLHTKCKLFFTMPESQPSWS